MYPRILWMGESQDVQYAVGKQKFFTDKIGNKYWRSTLVVNQTELLKNIIGLWKELMSEDLGLVEDWLEHKSACPAYPSDWDNHFEDENNWYPQPDCTCGSDEVFRKCMRIDGLIENAEKTREHRVRRKVHKLLVESLGDK